MPHFYPTILKPGFVKFVLTAILFLAATSAKAQPCYEYFSVYQVSPYGALCSPQYVTLRAEHYDYQPYGEFRWYSSDTDPFPVQTGYIDPWSGVYNDYYVYANHGATVWVSFYNYNTGCESDRQPYTFYISSPPSLFQDYATKCNYDVAKVQLSSNASGVYFELYKYVEYYDPNYGWVQEYQLQQSNSTGYFEIWDFDPQLDQYSYYARLYQPYGCGTSWYYPLYFDITGPGAPSISGNLNIAAGATTTLTASGNAYNFNWYDASNNLINTGWQYTTPSTLTPSAYTYQVRGTSQDGTCLTDPAYVTVTISYPNVIYTSLYNSSNFTKTVDLSKPVGTISATPGVTGGGGASYSIPIYAPPGTHEVKPSLAVTYNSQAGNGVLGYGWSISGLSAITRIGKNLYHNGITAPLSYTNEDGFTLDGVRLNAISGTNGANGTTYAMEVESFAAITSYGANANNPDWFKVITKDGTTLEFGNTTDARVLTDNGQNVMLWRINKITDQQGNYITFKYDNGFRDSRIDEINYVGNASTGLQPYNKIKFNYETREDRSVRYEGGASLASRHLLKSIAVTSEGNTVKTYTFNYGFDNIASLLKEVIESGSDGLALNSTIFLYGDQPQNLFTQSTFALQGSYDFFSGDFDADGISDLLAAETYFDANINTRLHSNYSLIQDVQQSSYILMYNRTLPQNVGSQVVQDKKFFNFLTADYDGDGRDDVIEVYSTSENMHCSAGYKRNVSGGMITYTKSFNNQTGYTNYTQESFGYPTDWLGNQYRYVSDKGIFFIPGDFDGDGNQDFIFVLGKKRQVGTCLIWPRYEYDYKAFLSSPSTDEMNEEILSFGFGSNPSPDFYAGTVANADLINTLDFDGDGKLEILVTKDYQSHVLRIQRVSATTGYSFGATVVHSTSEITKDSKVYPGDFNNDRKTDFLVRNSNGSWKVLYGTGTGFIAATFTFNQTPNVTSSDPDKVIVSDFNGDGHSDIVHGYEVPNTSTSRFSLYYYKGQNSASPFYYEQYTYNNVLAYDNLTVGDFNGDGRSDLLNRWNVQSPAEFISFKQFGRERLLAKVTDGHNSTTEFQYKRMTDKSTWPYFYNRTVSLDDPSNLNPFNYVQLPIYAVSALIVPNGIGGNNTTSYMYEDAVIHRYAKGLLGFRKIISKNAAAGTTTTTENGINTQFAIAYNSKQTTSLTATGQILAESFATYTFANVGTGYFDKRCHQKLDNVRKVDHVKGFATEEANTYDIYGNITTHVMKTGSPSGSTVNAIETITTTTTYGIHNTPVAAKPDQVTKTMARSGASVQSHITQYLYNGTGLVSSQTTHYGQPKAVTTTFTYDGVGNVSTITVSATGIASRVTTHTYDGKGRFIATRETASGTPIAQLETFVYDGKWGKPLSKTGSDCLTTTYEYDGFGRPKKTIDPEFTANYSLVWDIQGNHVYYSLTDFTGGQPDAKSWFDRLGREIKKQTAGFNNQWITTTTTYDAKGNVASTTRPYYSNETPITTTQTYDAYNRPAMVSSPLKTITFSYTQPASGQVTMTSTEQTGQVTSKTIDATGKVVGSTDKGGSLTFTYDSYGKQTEVKHGSTIMLTNTYDAYGRQTGTTDKNAGTITYEYDALGQLVIQTDNTNHTYQMAYDALGRIISRQGAEGATTYEYFKDNTTGCSNNNIKKITGFNGVIKEYTYDNLRRMQTETVTISGIPYVSTFGYDSYSRMNKVTYPSGVEVNNTYDINGFLQTVTAGNPGQQTTLFTGTQMNGHGRYTAYTLGNNIGSQVTYQYGVPMRYYTPGVQDLNMTWDFSRGNLLSRQDAIKGITESFQYDDLNRLTQSAVNAVVQNAVNYDGNSSFSMGNITSKTDAGNYVYRNDKIHAVAYITNPAGNTAPPVTTSQTEQTITYTPFLRAATINENPHQLVFTYGPDYQRIKTELYTNNILTETKIFLGNYEKQTDNAGTREIHYIHGGTGLCAMLVKQNGTNNFYVTYTDHLNSVLTVTDLSGNITAEQNFDPWGRKRNPQNWTYASVPSVPVWLYRGYTGHEHLPQFALINMNGRLYDPVQARMLSPDNFVPNPFSTQGYNRYAYALNNPLVYVDPDGNNPLLIIAIFAGAFAVGNTVAHAINGDIHDFWDGVGYFFQGAITGAILGTGVGFGLGVPVLGGILKVTGLVYAGFTAVSVGSGLVNGIFTGDWTRLRNAGMIFLGNFYLDENRTFFGGVLQGVSRFSWEFIQTTIGYNYTQMRNTVGNVDDVEFFGGVTFAFRLNFNGPEQGVSIGNYINLRVRDGNTDILSDPLYMHEYGHTLQSLRMGILYPFAVMIPSAMSAGRNQPMAGAPGLGTHDITRHEMGANRWAARYFGRHFGIDWTPFEPPLGPFPRRWP